MSAVAVGGNSDLADQTRRQLDELESLLGRMLDIPVIQVDAETLDARMAFAANRRPSDAHRGVAPIAAPPGGKVDDVADHKVLIADVSTDHAPAGVAEMRESHSCHDERSPAISEASVIEPFEKHGLEGPRGEESHPLASAGPPSAVLPWQPPAGFEQSASLLQAEAPHVPSFAHAGLVETTIVHDEPHDPQAAMPEEGPEQLDFPDHAMPRNLANEARLIFGVAGVCLWIIALSWALVEWMGWTS
jgi:hypothetical protein